jgi:beta-glucosidase
MWGSVDSMSNAFPDGFLWGTATAAYQIEGAVDEAGRGPSIWDRFSHSPGMTDNGDTGDIACDHLHRWEEDLELMAELGVTAYRFSISWSRVFPQGRGSVNHEGLAFYDRIVDRLLDLGITPFPTLYHWDLPQALEDEGGWLARSTAGAFAEYADLVVGELGDRVANWMTLNEPWCSAILGYMAGYHAPGVRGMDTGLTAAHHLLLGHGLAVGRVREHGIKIGIVVNQDWKVPASAHPADVAAARLADQKMAGWFLDPLLGRGYPGEAMEDYGWDQAVVQPGDLEIIAQPIDHLGLNYYTREVVRASSLDEDERSDALFPGPEFTDMGWEVQPEGLTVLLRRLAEEYGQHEIYVTENGAAYPDAADESGVVDDQDRVSYLQRHLAAAREALQAGVALRGYFVWSFLDNFEWTFGYSKRFGIVRTDFPTQRRTPKASFAWYRGVIERNGIG